jgi:hypothetical protein
MVKLLIRDVEEYDFPVVRSLEIILGC